MLAASMGDPAGVGLEIAAKAHAAARAGAAVPPFLLVADPAAAAEAARAQGGAIAEIEPADAARAWPNRLPVVPVPLAEPAAAGRPDPANAAAILEAIERSVRLARNGETEAVVTLPIAKAPLYEAGFRFPGHTEYIAALTADMPWDRPRGPVMMLAGENLKVALATIHLPLADVAAALTRERLETVICVLADALAHDFGVANPRIALAGLNPHAGEGGALGREEREIINPIAAALRAKGLDVTDAQAADTLFHREARARYDAAVAMYHDQGLIPLKTLHFWDAANITLGLPIVRASPDHGTGFDIAGRGVARPDSFIAALRMADAIAKRRARR